MCRTRKDDFFFLSFFPSLKGHWPKENKHVKKSCLSPDPAKKTIEVKAMGGFSVNIRGVLTLLILKSKS